MGLFYSIFFTALVFFLSACSAPPAPPVKVSKPAHDVSFIKDVQPILNKRCVVCHSCYNSPCQAKFSSYEGIDRGGSKILVYDGGRLNAIAPTRLFIDASTTKEWRGKGFYSLTQNDANASYNDSIMLSMLHEKKIHPDVIGSYSPEQDDLICPRNRQEMGEYLKKKPNHGMPYGLPALSLKEYTTLADWITLGAKGPTPAQQKKLITPSKEAQKQIEIWEQFLNKKDFKHIITARYLYEHFFLAHIHFQNTSNREFYRLVRSSTPAPLTPKEIATIRPFDDPKTEKFYYRFIKIHATLVRKTHMVVSFDAQEFKRIKQQFIDTKWNIKPHQVGYDTKTSANPFLAFEQIPPRVRYQFLLDHAHYIIMTFIRGPVCRGQIALNVIHDHFWVMFKDPNHDVGVLNPHFLSRQVDNLSMPIESRSQNLLKTFSDAYRNHVIRYIGAKAQEEKKFFPQGEGLESIWKGERPQDAPILTVYRHFDSASVHKGVLGALPRTLWVIDYAQLERIYYSLVAGYDVFGNVAHQTNIRRYMDFLRLEGERNFITYLPKDVRFEMLNSWYIKSDLIVDTKKQLHLTDLPSQVHYATDHYKSELIQRIVKHHILKTTGIDFDNLNYTPDGKHPPKMPDRFDSVANITIATRSLTAPGTGFIKHVTNDDVNVMYVRIKDIPEHKDVVVSLVVNRWHDNVNSLFSEGSRLNPDKDTLEFVKGFVGSYPNGFSVVSFEDLGEFFDLIQNFDENKKYLQLLGKFYIPRSSEKFWETYDWFQKRFYEDEPIESGLFDLNRYFRH